MTTRIMIEDNIRDNTIVARLVIDRADLARAKGRYTSFDNVVINDTLGPAERSVADRLLGLGFVVRRIEECNSTSILPTEPTSSLSHDSTKT